MSAQAPNETLLQIHKGWKEQGSGTTLVVPPGCGASWMARELVDTNRIASECNLAERIVCYRCDGRAVNDEWAFVRRACIDWGVAEAWDSDTTPELKWIKEDKDAASALSFLVKMLHEKGRLPVLVVDNFHRLARVIEAVCGEMRMLEQDGLMNTVVISPVSLEILKSRLQASGVFFANSDYGDDHDKCYVGELPDDISYELVAASLNMGLAHEVCTATREILGRRAIAYMLGLKSYMNLCRQYPDNKVDFAKFKEALLALAPNSFERLLKWLDTTNGFSITSAIMVMKAGDSDACRVLKKVHSVYRDLLISEDGKSLSCVGLAIAAEKRLAQQEASSELGLVRIAGLCVNWRYTGIDITQHRINRWLRQFSPNVRDIWIPILELLRQDYYFDEKRVNKYLVRLHKKAIDMLQNKGEWGSISRKKLAKYLRFVEVAGRHKSEGRMLHQYRLINQLFVQQSHIDIVLNDWVQSKSPDRLVIFAIDDFIGSGDSACEYLGGALRRVLKDKTDLLERLSVCYLAMVGFKEGAEKICQELPCKVDVIIEKVLDDSDRLFSSESSILTDREAQRLLKDECTKIGEVLRPREPLGYKKGQSLVTFHYDVPNNSLPVFYQFGNYNGKEWMPLFPRPDSKSG